MTFKKTYTSMIKGKKNTQWATMEAKLLLHLIITLIRSPKVKELFYNSNFPEFMKPIIYRQMTVGKMKAVELSKSLLQGQESELALHFLKDEKRNGLEILAKHIMEGYRLRIFRVSGEERLYLSDEPIILQKFSDADYMLPVSPKRCIGAVKIKLNGEMIQIDSKVYNLTDEEIREINYSSVQNTSNIVIVQRKEDLENIKNLMDKI